jgi:uroporphyrinogen-III synthase
VVITRAWHQGGEFSQKLEAQKAVPLNYPCVEILAPEETSAIDQHATALFAGAFDWLVLTSQNAVMALSSRIKDLRIQQPLPARLKFAAIGATTAAAAHDFLGIDAHAVPQVYNSESLGQLLGHCRGQRMLLPQADIARPELAQQLRHAGADVVCVTAYRTQKGSGGVNIVDYLRRRKVDAITFASPSAVNYFLERLKEEGGSVDLLRPVCIACIGNVTEKAVRDAGLQVGLVSKQHTVDSLIQSLKEHYSA